MSTNKSMLTAAVMAIGLSISAPAHAVTYYNWTFTGLVTGSGSLTTDGSCGTGCETITAIDGTFAGVQIGTLLPSGTWPIIEPNDNQLFPTSPTSLLDESGVSFSRISASNVNIYWWSPDNTYEFCLVDASSCGVGNTGLFSITAASAVPLPSALPLFAAGLGALGLLGWCRKRKAQAGA